MTWDKFSPYSKFWTKRQSTKIDEDFTRTPYEHDYGRVIHSAAFRRLQAKTQVFGVGENDFYRTRLTHSLEVSQIGEGITKKLHRELEVSVNLDTENENKMKWLPHPVLMRVICLSHDLGHPPFGHGGEVALNRCMLDYGGFEGNGQALRIVTRLEKYSKKHGMDLTRRSVLGLIKYPASFKKLNTFKDNTQSLPENPIFKAKKYKPPKCYLGEEDKTINWLSEGLEEWAYFSAIEINRNKKKHNKTIHKSLDASIMEVADDIAYGVHDLEDCIALGKIKFKEFKKRFPLQLINHLSEHSKDPVKDLFHGSNRRKNIIGAIVNYFIKKTLIKKVVGFEHPLFKYRVILSNEAGEVLEELQNIVKELVIKNPEVQHLEFKGQKIVTELFHAFKTDPKRLLQRVDYKRIKNGEEEERVICDYIAGMTDEYAITRYQNLFEPRAGSIFDRL